MGLRSYLPVLGQPPHAPIVHNEDNGRCRRRLDHRGQQPLIEPTEPLGMPDGPAALQHAAMLTRLAKVLPCLGKPLHLQPLLDHIQWVQRAFRKNPGRGPEASIATGAVPPQS